jgi:alkanesulfonate monooxygenase
MSLSTLWVVPVAGDGRRDDPAARTRPRRFRAADYLAQVARAAEAAGFDGLFLPLDSLGDDAWILAPALARVAPRLRIVPEFAPGHASAVYTAKMALSFQRYFSDRLGWKPFVDVDGSLGSGLSDGVTGADAYARATEYLETLRGVWGDAPFTYRGRFVDVEGGGFFEANARHNQRGHRVLRRAAPAIYLDGDDAAALHFSARFADVHLFTGTDDDALHAAIGHHRALAGEHGRSVRYGVRLRVVAREFDVEADRDARRIYGDLPDDVLVGSYAYVAGRLAALAELGIETFVLEATPALEGAYEIGQYVLPLIAPRDAHAVAGRG